MSKLLQNLLVSMTDKNCSKRPYLDDIFKHCNKFFKSQNLASEEVDKLVSYVLGSTLEVCPIANVDFMYRPIIIICCQVANYKAYN